MNGKEIYSILQEHFPDGAALSWDNVGLLCGRMDREIKKIYVTLDADMKSVERAAALGADLILTHHPLIFSAVKRINEGDYLGERLLKIIENHMACYAMHTNYDVLGMAELAGNMFELKDAAVLDETFEQEGRAEGIGRVGCLKETVSLEQCCELVKTKLLLDSVKVFGDLKSPVKRIAVSPGAGKSEIANAVSKGADVLITGDIGHHEGLDALAQGLMIIDAGHYGTEYIFIEDMKEFLKKHVPKVEIITAPIRHPFTVI